MTPSPRLLIALAFVAFVSLGLPDCVLGVAWPSLRATFDQPLNRLRAPRDRSLSSQLAHVRIVILRVFKHLR